MAADGRVVTADEVLSHEFDVTSFRPGYDQRDVDTLLDEVIATLRAYEQGGRLARMTTADDVLSAQFRSTQLRAGGANAASTKTSPASDINSFVWKFMRIHHYIMPEGILQAVSKKQLLDELL